MDTNELQERYEYLVKEIKGIIKISERNDYDLYLLPSFTEDLESFLEELKEIRDNV